MAYQIIHLENDENVNRIQNNIHLAFQEVLFELEELKKRVKTLEGENHADTQS